MAGKSENKTYIESKENMLAGIEHHRVIIWVNLVSIWIKGEFLAAFAPHLLSQKSLGLLLGPDYMEVEDRR